MLKIVPIFDNCLYVVHYDDDEYNAYNTLKNQWNNPEYLINLCRENRDKISLNYDCYQFADYIQDDFATLEQQIEAIADENRNFDEVFEPLHYNEYQSKQLSQRKAKRFRIRIYAIRIDSDRYIITGGAIKFSQTMQGHELTSEELKKLNRVQDFLKENGIFDDNSFHSWELQQ